MFSALIIDADGKTPNSIKGMLAPFPFEFTVTHNGPEAVSIAQSVSPNIIFVRAELPLTSGFSVCNRLRRDGQTKKIPVILYSSNVKEEVFNQHRALRTAANDYLRMPFDGQQLVDSVGQVLNLDEEAPAAKQPAAAPTPSPAPQSSLQADPEPEPESAKSGSFRSQREVLQLKAQLNAKKREILALTDDLEVRDRAILDAKHKNRELQAQLSDLEAGLLSAQELVLSSQEQTEAAHRDRATGHKREEGLRLRFEGAQKKIKEFEAELDQTRTGLHNQIAKLETAQVNLQSELSDSQLALAELAEAKVEVDAALSNARNEVTELTSQLEATKDRVHRLEADLAQQATDHQLALEQAAAEHSAEIEALREAQQAAQTAATDAHRDAIARLEAELDDTRFHAREHQERMSSALRESQDSAHTESERLRDLIARTEAQALDDLDRLTHTMNEAEKQAREEITRLTEAMKAAEHEFVEDRRRVEMELIESREHADKQAEVDLQRLEETSNQLRDTSAELERTKSLLQARNVAGVKAQQALAIALKLLEEHDAPQ